MLTIDRPAGVWDGNLDHFSLRASSRAGTIAGLVAAADGEARAWVNLRHVHPERARLVWMRLRYLAATTGFGLIYAHELAGLAADGDQQATAV